MAAKRLFDEVGDDDQDLPNPKRTKNRPTLASVIREVVVVNFFENLCSALEPMFRRVVNEEVENGLRLCMRSISRSPSLRIQATPDHKQMTTLQLLFNKKLSLPIFTGTKIVDVDNDPLQILLIDTTGGRKIATSLPYSFKVEILVLDGGFLNGDENTWNDQEFDKNIVKERSGKRPLLAGELNVTMRDGIAMIGDIEFTDNSSWIRSRKFRIGARVVQGSNQSVRIREAMSEAFVVKDHRGELYKKHHPPALEDKVWRLEKIGKGGAFDRKLSEHGIKTVQDFLKLYSTEPSKLRRILGVGMSERMWEVTLKHAQTCVLGTKLYRSRGPNYILTLNPICQIIKVEFDGRVYFPRDLKTMHTAYIENLVKDAYAKWNSLEEVLEPALLTQGEMVAGPYPNEHQVVVRSSYMGQTQSLLSSNGSSAGYTDWAGNSGFYPTENGFQFFSESSSNGDLC